MSARNDRSPVRTRIRLFTAAVILLIVAGAWWYAWQGVHSVGPSPQAVHTGLDAPPPDTRQTEEPLPIVLYIPANGALVAQTIALKRHSEPQLHAREVVAAVLGHQRSVLLPVLKELRLHSLYLSEAGTVFLNLTAKQPSQTEIRSSAWDELLALYALVNTIMQNVPEVKQVHFLKDGMEVQTLAGHMDLTRSYVRRTDLIRQE
jgi:hypothetical protein